MQMETGSQKEKVILEYAWKSAADPSSITNKDLARLRKVNLTEEEIVEIQEIIGIALGFNTFYDSLISDQKPQV